MPSTKKNTKKQTKTTSKKRALSSWNITVMLSCAIASFVIGISSGDPIIGSILLAAGLIDSYLTCNQKKQGYIFGAINAILVAYVGFVNHFYGAFILNAFIYAPLQIIGLFTWSKNQDKDHRVRIRKLTPKNAFILISLCVAGSFLIGYGLTMIPNQQMAFLDATVCCIEIAARTIQNLRYAEAWWLWVIADIFAISLWRIAFEEGGDNTFMNLLSTIAFFGFDTYGLIKWHHNLSKRKSPKKQTATNPRRTK